MEFDKKYLVFGIVCVLFLVFGLSLRSSDIIIIDPGLILDEGVEDDLRFPIMGLKLKGTINDPTYEYFINNTLSLSFDDTKTEEVFISFQLPHTRQERTNLSPHFHWSTKNNNIGNVVWCYEYSYANINEVFTSTTIKCVVDSTDGTSYKHLMSPMINIDGSNLTTSAMLNGRIFRNGTDIRDTLIGDADLFEFDIHYLKDKLGD